VTIGSGGRVVGVEPVATSLQTLSRFVRRDGKPHTAHALHALAVGTLHRAIRGPDTGVCVGAGSGLVGGSRLGHGIAAGVGTGSPVAGETLHADANATWAAACQGAADSIRTLARTYALDGDEDFGVVLRRIADVLEHCAGMFTTPARAPAPPAAEVGDGTPRRRSRATRPVIEPVVHVSVGRVASTGARTGAASGVASIEGAGVGAVSGAGAGAGALTGRPRQSTRPNGNLGASPVGTPTARSRSARSSSPASASSPSPPRLRRTPA
jgi:hypothetical protein